MNAEPDNTSLSQLKNLYDEIELAFLPGFDRYLVTASQDSPEARGCTDRAIGHFPAEESVRSGVHRVVFDWWKGQADEYEQHRWACLFAAGDVDAATAASWADQIWDPDSGEPLAVSA